MRCSCKSSNHVAAENTDRPLHLVQITRKSYLAWLRPHSALTTLKCNNNFRPHCCRRVLQNKFTVPYHSLTTFGCAPACNAPACTLLWTLPLRDCLRCIAAIDASSTLNFLLQLEVGLRSPRGVVPHAMQLVIMLRSRSRHRRTCFRQQSTVSSCRHRLWRPCVLRAAFSALLALGLNTRMTPRELFVNNKWEADIVVCSKLY